MVDRLVPNRTDYVIAEENARQFNANLLCVEGGHNKYYIMQVLRKNHRPGSTPYRFYRRWGRCGTDGQYMSKDYATVEEAIADFNAILEDKMEEYSEVHVTYP